jgi:hypothetical protein
VFLKGLSSKGLSIGLHEASAFYKNYRTIEFARMISREIGDFVPPTNNEQQLRPAARINSGDEK